MTVIPNFILKRLYVPGSLHRVPAGVAFSILNNLGPGMITKVNSVTLNQTVYPAHRLMFEVDSQILDAETITEENPASFFLNQTITCIVKDTCLDAGTYEISVDLISKEAGRVCLTVQDQLDS